MPRAKRLLDAVPALCRDDGDQTHRARHQPTGRVALMRIALSTTTGPDGEYASAVADAGGEPSFLRFDVGSLDDQLAPVAGVLVTGGGDVDPRCYGSASTRATDVDAARDAFEIALVQRARARGIPTLCICRGLQVANVAFGGTLVPDIADQFGPQTGALHRRVVDGSVERGLIAAHAIDIAADSHLAGIVGAGPLITGSRHHQSLAAVAPDLRVVAATRDGVVEAAEARFATPFWLGVQWHPESTRDADGGASAAIFAAFVAAAGAFVLAAPDAVRAGQPTSGDRR